MESNYRKYAINRPKFRFLRSAWSAKSYAMNCSIIRNDWDLPYLRPKTHVCYIYSCLEGNHQSYRLGEFAYSPILCHSAIHKYNIEWMFQLPGIQCLMTQWNATQLKCSIEIENIAGALPFWRTCVPCANECVCKAIYMSYSCIAWKAFIARNTETFQPATNISENRHIRVYNI